MQVNESQSVTTANSQGIKRVIDVLENELSTMQSQIVQGLRESSQEFLTLNNFYLTTCNQYSVENANADFTRFSEALMSLLSMDVENRDLSSIARNSSGQFVSAAKYTIAQRAVEAMKRIGTKIVSIDDIVADHNKHHPDHHLTNKQFSSRLYKDAAKGKLFISAGDGKYSLMNADGE